MIKKWFTGAPITKFGTSKDALKKLKNQYLKFTTMTKEESEEIAIALASSNGALKALKEAGFTTLDDHIEKNEKLIKKLVGLLYVVVLVGGKFIGYC